MLDSFEFFEFQNFNVHVHVTINTYLLDCTAPELLLVKYIQCQLCIFFIRSIDVFLILTSNKQQQKPLQI